MRVRSAMTSQCRTQAASGATVLARPLLALILAATLVGGPVSPAYAQAAPQNPPPAPAPQAAPSAVNTPISLGTAKYHFSRAPRPFPNLFAPYRAIKVPPSSVVNSPRIEQFIHDNKLERSEEHTSELQSPIDISY